METQEYLVEEVQAIRAIDDMTILLSLGHDGLYKKTRIRLHRVSSGQNMREDDIEYAMRYLRSVLLSKKRQFTVKVKYRRGSSWIVELLYADENGSTHSINEEMEALGFSLPDRNAE